MTEVHVEHVPGRRRTIMVRRLILPGGGGLLMKRSEPELESMVFPALTFAWASSEAGRVVYVLQHVPVVPGQLEATMTPRIPNVNGSGRVCMRWPGGSPVTPFFNTTFTRGEHNSDFYWDAPLVALDVETIKSYVQTEMLELEEIQRVVTQRRVDRINGVARSARGEA